MRRRHGRAATAISIVLALAALAATAADEDAASQVPVHDDAQATVAAALDVVRALWAEDSVAANAALDRLEPRTRVLNDAGDESFGPDPVAYSQAMRTTIARTREALGRADHEQAFNMFVWTQRSCMGCHAALRRATP